MEPYESILQAMTPEVSFGSTTIRIFKPSELPSGQVGYSSSLSGQSLTGDVPGDWRKTWLVIGYDESCSDPIFIDISEPGYSVYTAMVGQGRWDPRPIAVCLEAFAFSLSALAAVAQGREHPVALEENPLTDSEKETVLSAIKRANPKLDTNFWDAILTNS